MQSKSGSGVDLAKQGKQDATNLDDIIDIDATALPTRTAHAFLYRGTLRPDGTRVAIKSMRYAPRDEKMIKRILGEVDIWSKLRHENIIPALGFTTKCEHTVAIVTPWMSMGNAHDYVQNQIVDPRPLLVEVARGLNYLHTCDIGPVIHNDLRGANVLISNDGHAFLDNSGFFNLINSSFSLTLSIPGTSVLNWLSPEVLESDQYDPTRERDVWTFGMLALELFTRKSPFHEVKHQSDILKRILQGPPDRPSTESACDRLTDEWWDVCNICWQRQPALRPPMSVILSKIEQMIEFMDVGLAFSKLSDQAAVHCININGLIDRDEGFSPLRGGPAVIYQGTFRPDGRRVAIKTIGPRGDVYSMKQVLREVQIWSKLRHENVLPLLGITTSFNQTISIVTLWMEKGTAHSYVQDKAIDPRPLLVGIARALNYLHGHNSGPIIHGDIKGFNVLISDAGQALLTDFGLAYSSSVHQVLSRGGTVNWIAPEHLDSVEYQVTREGDIWAFGMTILELFTRKKPFHHLKTLPTLAIWILRGPPDRPSAESTCDRLNDEWWNICLRCWQRDPSSRPLASDILASIERIAVES